MLHQVTIDEIAASADPRTPFEPTEPGMEYVVAAPLFGPWYWGNPNLGPDSYFNPRTYPYPADTGNFIPRWSGAFIQPRNLDPMAYQLVSEGGLSGMDLEDWKILLMSSPQQCIADIRNGYYKGAARYCGITAAELVVAIGALWIVAKILRG